MIELFDDRNSVRGSQIVPVTHITGPLGDGQAGEKRPSAQPPPTSAGSGATTRDGAAGPAQPMGPLQATGKLLPLLLGLALMALLAHGVFKIDGYSLLWIAFCVGERLLPFCALCAVVFH